MFATAPSLENFNVSIPFKSHHDEFSIRQLNHVHMDYSLAHTAHTHMPLDKVSWQPPIIAKYPKRALKLAKVSDLGRNMLEGKLLGDSFPHGQLPDVFLFLGGRIFS